MHLTDFTVCTTDDIFCLQTVESNKFRLFVKLRRSTDGSLVDVFSVLEEHVRMDSGLSSAVRLVRVRSVARRSALRQQHAAGGEAELRQSGHRAFPEAVGHLH